MKFRSVLTDADSIQTVVRVLHNFCRFGNSFYLRLSATEIHLITEVTQNCSPFLVKCRLNPNDLFDEYVFEGITDANLIYFQMQSESCTRALSSLLPTIKTLRLKLKNAAVGQVLTLTVEYPNHDSDRSVTHQIKVDILRAQYWNDVYEEAIGDFDISLYLADGRAFTATTERLATFSHYMDIMARRENPTQASLIISIQSDSIAIKNKFSKLNLNLTDGSQTNSQEEWIKVRVDIRKINILFNSLKQLKTNLVVCNVRDKNRINFKFTHNSVDFEAFIANIEE